MKGIYSGRAGGCRPRQPQLWTSTPSADFTKRPLTRFLVSALAFLDS